jgi:hypothetical protein
MRWPTLSARKARRGYGRARPTSTARSSCSHARSVVSTGSSRCARQAGAVGQRQTQVACGLAESRDHQPIVGVERDDRQRVAEARRGGHPFGDLVDVYADGRQPREHLSPVDGSHHGCLIGEDVADRQTAEFAERVDQEGRGVEDESGAAVAHAAWGGAVLGGILAAGFLATLGDQLV